MTANEVARELARIDLPLSTYTQWYWKIDLHNLLHFLTLRVDAHAQWEIQEYGRVMAGMLKRVAPLSYEAWIDYDVCGAHVVARASWRRCARWSSVEGDGLTAASGARSIARRWRAHGLAKREVDELLAKLAPPPAVPDFELDVAAGPLRRALRRALRGGRARPARSRPSSPSLRLVELDQVAAGIGEDRDRHRRPCAPARMRERDAGRLQPRELGRDVGDLERGHRNPLIEHRPLERLAGRVGVRLEGQLDVVRALGRHDGDRTCTRRPETRASP